MKILNVTEKALLERLNRGEINDLQEVLLLKITRVEHSDGLNLARIFDLSRQKNAFPGLLCLDLSNNGLTSLPEGVFEGFNHLKEIRLKNNYLVTLPIKLFQGLVNLQEINLLNNNFSEFSQALLNNLDNLAILNLEGNRFTTVPHELLEGVQPELVNLKYNFELCTDGRLLSLDKSQIPSNIICDRLMSCYRQDDPDVLKLMNLSLRGNPEWQHNFTESEVKVLNNLYNLRQAQFHSLESTNWEAPPAINALIFGFSYNTNTNTNIAVNLLPQDKNKKRSRSDVEPADSETIKQSVQKKQKAC
jgi:hypothetical protein